ncbi:hypothetical protein HDU76_002839 [Blyttiomyces sp. JEL0837]|nr:hypothetical protein HDU76_002839 [Blyttiomyces sp. JEL0837]
MLTVDETDKHNIIDPSTTGLSTFSNSTDTDMSSFNNEPSATISAVDATSNVINQDPRVNSNLHNSDDVARLMQSATSTGSPHIQQHTVLSRSTVNDSAVEVTAAGNINVSNASTENDDMQEMEVDGASAGNTVFDGDEINDVNISTMQDVEFETTHDLQELNPTAPQTSGIMGIGSHASDAREQLRSQFIETVRNALVDASKSTRQSSSSSISNVAGNGFATSGILDERFSDPGIVLKTCYIPSNSITGGVGGYDGLTQNRQYVHVDDISLRVPIEHVQLNEVTKFIAMSSVFAVPGTAFVGVGTSAYAFDEEAAARSANIPNSHTNASKASVSIQFSSNWSIAINNLATRVAPELGIRVENGKTVQARFQKLLLQDRQGSSCLVDLTSITSERVYETSFGKLFVQLPVTQSSLGGSIIARRSNSDGGNRSVADVNEPWVVGFDDGVMRGRGSSSLNVPETSRIASTKFFAIRNDVSFEVSPVTCGWKVRLLYDLVVVDGVGVGTGDHEKLGNVVERGLVPVGGHDQTCPIDRLKGLVRQWIGVDGRWLPNKLLVALEHEYSSSMLQQMGVSGLRGRDKDIFELLAGLTIDLQGHLDGLSSVDANISDVSVGSRLLGFVRSNEGVNQTLLYGIHRPLDVYFVTLSLVVVGRPSQATLDKLFAGVLNAPGRVNQMIDIEGQWVEIDKSKQPSCELSDVEWFDEKGNSLEFKLEELGMDLEILDIGGSTAPSKPASQYHFNLFPGEPCRKNIKGGVQVGNDNKVSYNFLVSYQHKRTLLVFAPRDRILRDMSVKTLVKVIGDQLMPKPESTSILAMKYDFDMLKHLFDLAVSKSLSKLPKESGPRLAGKALVDRSDLLSILECCRCFRAKSEDVALLLRFWNGPTEPGTLSSIDRSTPALVLKRVAGWYCDSKEVWKVVVGITAVEARMNIGFLVDVVRMLRDPIMGDGADGGGVIGSEACGNVELENVGNLSTNTMSNEEHAAAAMQLGLSLSMDIICKVCGALTKANGGQIGWVKDVAALYGIVEKSEYGCCAIRDFLVEKAHELSYYDHCAMALVINDEQIRSKVLRYLLQRQIVFEASGPTGNTQEAATKVNDILLSRQFLKLVPHIMKMCLKSPDLYICLAWTIMQFIKGLEPSGGAGPFLQRFLSMPEVIAVCCFAFVELESPLRTLMLIRVAQIPFSPPAFSWTMPRPSWNFVHAITDQITGQSGVVDTAATELSVEIISFLESNTESKVLSKKFNRIAEAREFAIRFNVEFIKGYDAMAREVFFSLDPDELSAGALVKSSPIISGRRLSNTPVQGKRSTKSNTPAPETFFVQAVEKGTGVRSTCTLVKTRRWFELEERWFGKLRREELFLMACLGLIDPMKASKVAAGAF